MFYILNVYFSVTSITSMKSLTCMFYFLLVSNLCSHDTKWCNHGIKSIDISIMKSTLSLLQTTFLFGVILMYAQLCFTL